MVARRYWCAMTLICASRINGFTSFKQLFKKFSDNPGFKKWLSDVVLGATDGEVGNSGVYTGIVTGTGTPARG